VQDITRKFLNLNLPSMVKMDKKTEGVEIRRIADRNFVNSYEILHDGERVYEFHALIIDDHFVLMDGIENSVLGVCDYGRRSDQDNKTVRSNVENASIKILKLAQTFARGHARVNGNLQIKDLSNPHGKSLLQLVDSPQDIVNILTEPN